MVYVESFDLKTIGTIQNLVTDIPRTSSKGYPRLCESQESANRCPFCFLKRPVIDKKESQHSE